MSLAARSGSAANFSLGSQPDFPDPLRHNSTCTFPLCLSKASKESLVARPLLAVRISQSIKKGAQPRVAVLHA
jgi:hypothetical protein